MVIDGSEFEFTGELLGWWRGAPALLASSRFQLVQRPAAMSCALATKPGAGREAAPLVAAAAEALTQAPAVLCDVIAQLKACGCTEVELGISERRVLLASCGADVPTQCERNREAPRLDGRVHAGLHARFPKLHPFTEGRGCACVLEAANR